MNNNPFGLLSELPAPSDMAETSSQSPPTRSNDLIHSDMSVADGSTLCYDDVEIGPMSIDQNGCIIHEGLRNPGYMLDSMAWGFIDDYTGVWKAKGLPPLHYFDCIRFWAWSHSRDPPNPRNIRDIRLPKKEVVERTPEVHESAMAAAYGLWAEEYLHQQKHQMFGASPLPAPIGPPSNQIWGDDRATLSVMPLMASDEQFRPPSVGGVPLPPQSLHTFSLSGINMGNFKMTAFPTRADSVITSYNTSTPSGSARRDTALSTTSSGSPVKRPTHSRHLSALAMPFDPATGKASLALSSRAGLPTPPGQLPGTFDILHTNDRRAFTCLVVTEVPFNVTINEILTHLKLGEREGLVHYGPDNPAIHIIQDRSDSKTHEVYVEMLTYEAANRVIRDIPRRGIKIGSTGGSRKIRVQLCAQDNMMRAIFPRPAKSHAWQFRWVGYDPDNNSIPDGFIGYVTSEDLHNARDWAEHPRKAKHAEDSPQRVYEFMVTTLVHLPKDIRYYGRLKGWRDVKDFIDRLFATVTAMIKTLNCYLDDTSFAERHVKREQAHKLNLRLLKKFNQTCFDFPLFSEAQREQLLLGV